MTLYRAFHLRPLGRLHLGERGIGLEETAEFARSDTIYGALCFAWAETFGPVALRELATALTERRPPFLVSSAFPRVGKVRLYPRPHLALPVAEEARRRLKDVRWVSEGILWRWLKGEGLESEAETVAPPLEHIWVTGEEAAALRAKPGPPWQRVYVARVTLDRTTSSSNLYYVGEVAFREDCGLFVLATSEDEVAMGRLEEALRALGEMGLGGERSVGLGRFEVEEVARWEPPGADGERFLTLSLYLPTLAELEGGVLGEGARYRLVRREGWIASPAWPGRRRKWVNMVQEGSLLCGDPAGLYGQVADVTPDERSPGAHPVLRVGFAFALPAPAARGG